MCVIFRKHGCNVFKKRKLDFNEGNIDKKTEKASYYWGFNKNLSPIFRVENLLTEKDFFRFSKLLSIAHSKNYVPTFSDFRVDALTSRN